ncbi:MAG: hypothetical protein Q9162_001187 [Coniocarpon cinnabarinum]
MFEGLVANLLNRFLGLYVKNFDPKQLSIGIWNNEVKLRNLELRKEALDQLKLPLNVIEGHVGELTLLIPLSNLRGKPVRVNIEDVNVLAVPREDVDLDPEEERNRKHRIKMEKLESAELLKQRNNEGLSKEEQQKQQSFVTSLTTAIVDNLQVTIKNIHVRYEDVISNPGHPFAAGLILHELSAVSTNDQWQPTFIQSSSDTTHKLAKLEALAFYWDTDADLIGPGKASGDAPTTEAVLTKIKEFGLHPSIHQYVLKPVSGQAGLQMDKTGKTDRPKVKARLFFDELGFILDDSQYRDSLKLLDNLHYFTRHQETKMLQPKSRPMEDPRAWLHFAGKAIFDQIHERNQKWSWSYLKERRDDRIRYIDLFKQRKREEQLPKDKQQEIEALERKLSYEDLRFWRSLARNQLRKEGGLKSTASQAQPQQQKQTWSSWIWSSGSSKSSDAGDNKEGASDESHISEKDKDALFSVIDWDEKAAVAEAVDVPKETVKVQVRVSLQTGSFTLKRDPRGENTEIVNLLFDSLHTTFIQRPTSSLLRLSLGGLRLYDDTTPNNLYRQTITVKDAPQLQIEDQSSNETEEAAVKNALSLSDTQADEHYDQAFFAMTFEQSPIDDSADSAVNVKLRGMEVVYNPALVVEIAKFFKPPETHMESISALMDSAGEAVEGIRKQTRAGLEFALEEHRSVNVKLDLQTPLIIVPDSVVKESSTCMIVDAGHISANSELISKDTIKEIQDKQSQQYSDEDYRRLEGLMYDKFNLKLESTQVLIGPNIRATREQLEAQTPSHNFHVIGRINMDFLVESCIVPKGSNLTKFRISGKLPLLHASFSDAKYKSLMRLISVAIPNFDDDDSESAQTASMTAQKALEEPNGHVETSMRPRSKSFQFSAQEHAILVDEEDEIDKQQTFEDTTQGHQDSEDDLTQRMFEFNFVVEKLQGSVFKSDVQHEASDKLLARLVGEHFGLQFFMRNYDMTAEVQLSSLALEDHVEEEPLEEFKNIISSEDSSDNPSKELLRVKYFGVNRNSPEFMTTYEGCDTNVEVAVSTINVFVTRRTLLTLLDFVMDTFVSSDDDESSQDEKGAGDAAKNNQVTDTQIQTAPESKIRIKTELKRIALILNNDGIRLATLGLDTASVNVLVLSKTMRVTARLGNMSLVDDVNQGADLDSPLRQLLTIEGDNLADFTYDTFDAESETYPGYDSAVYLRSGSLKVNFVTEPFRKIMDFGVKFGKMQTMFAAARLAAANQQFSPSGTMQFDVVMRTPIVVFPAAVVGMGSQKDSLTAYLGEVYAKNKYTPLDDAQNSDTANEFTAGIRNVRLQSLLHYSEDRSEQLELIEKVDLGFSMTNVEHKKGSKRPEWEIRSTLSDVNVRITSQQLKLVMGLVTTVPEAFATESDVDVERDVEKELPSTTIQPAKRLIKAPEGPSADVQKPSQLNPELGAGAEKWSSMDLVFKAGAIGLELIQDEPNNPVGDTKKASLSRFTLNRTRIKARMMSDGGLESELQIESFTIQDTRQRETNKFRKIMSLNNSDISQQFMASFTMSGGQESNMMVLLTVDSPRIILALDYLLAVQSFIGAGLTTEEEDNVEQILQQEEAASDEDLTGHEEKPSSKSEDKTKSDSGGSLSFRINLVDAQVVLLANPAMASSEAIVLGMKQTIVTQQHALTLQVEKVGMFLCRMDKFDTSRLRILDDFSIATSHDVRTQNSSSSMINIQVDVEPLILRLSVRDVQMILAIITKATSSSDQNKPPPKSEKPEKVKQIQGSSHAPSTRRASTARRQTLPSTKSQRTQKPSEPTEGQGQGTTSVILKREQANIHVNGIRVVLIGAVHELPILDWSVKQFGIDVRDWSGAMTAETSVDTFFNIYNFSKSAWEPLIEPWTIGFHMSQQQNPSKLVVELYSRKTMEATLTPASIALLYKTFVMMSDNNEDVLSKPRRSDAPYRLRNFTGFTMSVWSQSGEGSEGSAAKLSDGDEIPWRFEDASTTRETLAPEGSTGNLGIKLEESGFDSVDKIPVGREGEALYGLTPRQDKVLHRFLVEVKLESDNIKYITFRSPLIVENNTQIPIELGVYSPEEGHLVKVEKIAPGDYRPAPVGAAFMHSVVVRPDEGFGYTWSNERLFWKDLLKTPTNSITCRGEQGNDAPPFYFQMNAIYEKHNPLTKMYPYMKIRLSPPVELHNLLPYDFKYRIYDKNTKRDWTNFLRKGGISPGHVMSLSHLLLLSIDLQDVPFKQSDFAIINTPTREYKRESNLVVKDENDIPLRLKLHYYTMPDTGGAFKVSIYSSHVVLNRTGLELDLRSKQFMGTTKGAAGAKQTSKAGIADGRPERAKPFMFSFPTDDQKNRALVRVGDSDWSKPQSLNAIGTQYSATVPSPNGKSEMQLGVSITQGEGKYNLTKVVTVTPRYLIRSRLKEDVDIREPGSSNVTTLKSGDLHPLRYMRPNQAQQLSLCFPGLNNQWSAPFQISNVGRVHVKLAKEKQRQQLIKVEILMEEATIFLHLSETEQWPFAVRNESDTEFRFYQANPNVDAEDEDQSTNFRAIRYRIPPRSIMPYAWDYPASRNKDLVLDFEGKTRHVKLAEIGPQKPWSIPGDQGRLKAIGVDVVADGPKQELVLSNFKQALSMFRAKSSTSVKSMEDKFELKEQSSPVTMSINLRLAGFGMSIINQHFRELLYVTFRDLELKYNDSELYQTVDWTTKWIQIDNQLYGGIFPILLYPSVVPKTGRELETHPIFHAAVTRVKDDSYGVLYIKYATFLLQQMTCEIDEDFIFSMLDFIKIPGITPEVDDSQGKLCDEELDIPEPQKEEQGQDMYFELLHLQPIQIDLSFVRTERINAEDTMAVNNPFMFAVNVMTMSLGNVNDAPLRYNALMIENARISLAMLMSNIQSHFVQESLRQMHIVLGSADFLGNPVGLFNNVSSGVADIFYEPYQGLVMTDRPQDLGLGIAKGASSFVKKSVFGFSDSMAKFTGSISKGLAAASLDKEYQDQRRMSKSRNRPKHALYGITSGGNAFANTMASGIGGLARQPLEGAEKEGLGGFVKGVGKGVLGFATKTALAPIDLTSSVFEGVRNTTTLFDSTELDRVRPTRFIAADQVVRPYSQREALGQFWLKTCENGKYFNEQYIAHLDLATGGNSRSNAPPQESPVGGDMLVMLTYDRIMLIKTRNLRVEWDVPLQDIQRISKERTGMNMLLKNRQGPFLPISDESQRNFLYRQIKVAVDAYNEKWQARD